jgi:hypothetical protein
LGTAGDFCHGLGPLLRYGWSSENFAAAVIVVGGCGIVRFSIIYMLPLVWEIVGGRGLLSPTAI